MITLNGVNIAQPINTGVMEELIEIQHDNVAIDGTTQRNYINEKYQVSLTWGRLKVADYQQIVAMFRNGATVVYSNPQSKYSGGLTFTGLPSFKDAPYVPGASMLAPFSVVIRQV